MVPGEWLAGLVTERDPDLEPAFAFASAMNWVRALSILTADADADPVAYVRNQVKPLVVTQQRLWPEATPNRYRLSQCLVPLYMSANFANTLDHMMTSTVGDKVWSLLSSVMVVWYYALYYLGHAYVAAVNGTEPSTHAAMQRQMTTPQTRPCLVPPFNLRAGWGGKWDQPALDPVAWTKDATFPRKSPTNAHEAAAAVGAYFSGTWDWVATHRMAEVMRKNKFTNFRTVAARNVRDAALQPLVINMFHCLYRYRTKANYRDAVFTSYGTQFSSRPDLFIRDLLTVYKAFALNVEAYVCRRVWPKWYDYYISDIAQWQRDTQAVFPSRFQGRAVVAGLV